MTWVQIIVIIAVGLGILAFLGAVIGVLCPGPDYMPMSPDAEYQWLTEDIGLSPEEAEEVMRPIGRA